MSFLRIKGKELLQRDEAGSEDQSNQSRLGKTHIPFTGDGYLQSIFGCGAKVEREACRNYRTNAVRLEEISSRSFHSHN
jgi:hypothetical protein